MNVKAIVKVMNFHALLRVERSTTLASKYTRVSDELESMMRLIFNNKNLKVDKKLSLPSADLPPLKIYIGSDLGFCGNINSTIVSKINQDEKSEKIVIGKKVKRNKEFSLYLTQEDFEENFGLIKRKLAQAVLEKEWSEIYLVYNHYYNISKIAPVERKIYPLADDEDYDSKKGQWTDFAIEGDVSDLLEKMIVSYLSYQVKIAAASALASENTIRQSATTQSLKKLDEIEAETVQRRRTEETQASFKKTIDGFIQQKSLKQKA